MKHILALLVVFAGTAVALGCGEEEMGSAAKPMSAAGEQAPGKQAGDAGAARRSQGPLVKLRDSQLGPVLFSGSDRALYLFTRDRERASRCHGECAVAWPPFFAKARPRAGRGVEQSLLGTIRRGKRRQVTYAGQPLYFYVDDPKGQVLCNDIAEFDGTWFALTAEGKPPMT